MAKIYLSPSTQEWNTYVTGSGSEEYHMNLLADALEPYLLSCGIRWRRNSPDMTAAGAIRQANREGCDLYLALHSNAAPEGRYGQERGIIVFYYPGSTEGQRAAELIAEELRKIYPLPGKVITRATTALGEVRKAKAPAVLAEIGYHDNRQDARWLETHREAIAQQLARAVTAWFGLPFVYPMDPVPGRVNVRWGALNLRAYPSHSSLILEKLPDGTDLTVYGEWQGWYVVHTGSRVGYAAAAYIDT